MPKRTLLVDGDIFVYKAAAAAEVPIHWGDGLWTLHSYFDPTAVKLDITLQRLMDELEADDMIIALSDDENFRVKVLPTYKSNRKDKREPMLRQPLKQYLRDNYNVFQRPGLEGDDVLGILSTSKKIVKSGEKVIVSIDKDMKTIPGLLYNDGKPELGIKRVEEFDADYFHMLQTMMGDTTDGYKGCPGIGEKTGQKILDKAVDDGKSMWEAVVEAFEKKGLGESEALTQARVARICRNTDYDFRKKEVILWTP